MSALLANYGLSMLSETLDDTEEQRIATENRYRDLTRIEADKDGIVRGMGLPDSDPIVAAIGAALDEQKAREHQLILALQRQVRKSPLNAWVKSKKGIGEKQAARLMAVIGDPYWNERDDRPRTVSELWSYCGYSVNGSSAVRRQKGEKDKWSAKAKKRAFLMAQKCTLFTDGEYRAVYDAARLQYAEAVHPVDCPRCGPKGKPALAGSPLSLGHQHARALRRVAKEILKDMWIQAREYHESQTI